jgi:hypothetical protein
MITAKDYFEQNVSKAGTCFRTEIAKVRKVYEGDAIDVNNFGIPLATVAEQDGYHVTIGDIQSFMGPEGFADFEEAFSKATPEELGMDRVDLPKDSTFQPVKKGETIVTQPWSDTDLGVEAGAEQDGYLLTTEGKTRFFSDFDFRTTFNVQAAPQKEDECLYKSELGTAEAPVCYIVLDRDVTFDFADGAYDAKAGSVLVENPADVDGYTLFSRQSFLETFEVAKAARETSTPKVKRLGPK